MQLLILACAASAGVHAVLAPAHFVEATTLGLAFVAAAAALATAAVLLDRRPRSRAVIGGAAALLAMLIAAYLATRATALPLLGEHREPLDAVGVATKLVEAAGLVMAMNAINKRVAHRNARSAAEKGVQ